MEREGDDFNELLHFLDNSRDCSGLVPLSEDFNERVDSTFETASLVSSVLREVDAPDNDVPLVVVSSR